MDIQTQKEKRFLKIVAIGMPIMLIIGVILFGGHIWWSEKLSNPVVRLLESSEITATICDVKLKEPKRLRKSFDEITTNKNAGSHPLSLEFFVVETEYETYRLQLGQDSRDDNLFWVYPESGQLNTIVGGYIRSEYLANEYAKCK
jgi:hypothetical protein